MNVFYQMPHSLKTKIIKRKSGISKNNLDYDFYYFIQTIFPPKTKSIRNEGLFLRFSKKYTQYSFEILINLK